MSATYRPDIDGLRAVAIGAVLVFHAWPRAIQGGFVGVDVFFVISGYLITGLLLERLAAGTFSFADFYARRARRLLPALVLVLAAVLAVGWLVSLPWDYRQVGRRVAAATVFSANVSVLADRTGYFAPLPSERPLLHLWSLGVEEQFYVAWPMLLVWLARRREGLATLVAWLAASSLGVAVVWAAVAPVSAFYVPFTRFWELLGGAWLAIRERDGAAPAPVAWADAVVAAGLGVIVAVTWGATPAWPVWVPVGLAVAAAMAVVWAGRSSRLAAIVLANPVSVWLGLISYPLYLWHWPVQNLTLWPGAVINAPAARILLSVAVAGLTYHLWERPWRRWATTTAGLGAVVAVTAVVGMAGAVVWATGGVPQRLPEAVRGVFAITEVDAAWRTGRCFLDFPRGGPADFAPECLAPADGRPIVALWGDSHAAQFAPGLREAAEARGAFLAQWTVAGCTPVLDAPAYAQCVTFRQRLPERIVATRPDTVILSGIWPEAGAAEALAAAVAGFKQRGVREVVVAGPTPFWPPAGMLFRHYRATGLVPGRLSPGPALQAAYAFDAAVRDAVARAGGRYVSIVGLVCDATTCPTLTGDPPVAVSTDGDHFTPQASRLFSEGLLGPRR